ncbi:hypothetical protein FQN49_000238 [Arthroderma sp. PD_2]|nr:hypothetical protein FQN49_000238 [Arthroderma sp. PD_2]
MIDNATYPPDSPRHLLPAAACVGNTALVKSLLQGQDVHCNQASNFFGAPLHLAALNGHTDIVELLLKKGPDPNLVISRTGQYMHMDDLEIYPITPLQAAALVTNTHYCFAILNAIKGGHPGVVDYLLDCRDLTSIPRDSLDRFWYRALRIACINGSVDMVQMLLDKGVSVTQLDGPPLESPLTLAAGLGYNQIITLLLQNGADPNQSSTIRDRTTIITSPIKKAAKYGHIQSFQTLMGCCKPTYRPEMVIYQAAMSGQEHALRYLAETDIWPTLCLTETMAQVAETTIGYGTINGFTWMKSVLIDLGLCEPQSVDSRNARN